MTAAQLIPTPDTLLVPWGWFQILLTATFFLHLLVMNILLGCSLITFFRHAAGKSTTISKTISEKLPFTVAFTINFGVAPSSSSRFSTATSCMPAQYSWPSTGF